MVVKKIFIFGSFGIIMLLAFLSFVYADNIACYSNYDCVSGFIESEFCQNNDVYKNFLNSSCINPGTNISYCSNNTVPTFLTDCGNDENGNFSDNFCIGNNIYHSRTNILRGCRVINPLTNISGCFSELVFIEEIVRNCTNGCSNGQCINEIVCNSNSGCGANQFIGQPTCQNNNVFGNFITYICNNPGTLNSSCSNTTNFQLKQDCGNNDCGNYGANYCSNNSVYHSRTCNDRGCNSGICFNSSRNEETLVQTCSNGCSNGACLNVICTNDSDCGRNGFSTNKYCMDDDIYADYNEYKCLNPGNINSSCFINTTSRLFENCRYKCKNDECYSRNPLDYFDYEYNETEQQVYEYTGDVILATSFRSDNNVTIQEINPIIKVDNNTTNKLSINSLLWILIILVIILLVIIIVIIMIK